MKGCISACLEIPERNHEVIILLAHGRTTDGKKWKKGEAWAEIYRSTKNAAEAACCKMLAKPKCKRSYRLHLELEEAKTLDWAAELKGRLRNAARSKLSDFMEWGEPDADAHENLFRIIFEGVEDDDSPGDPGYSPWPGNPCLLPKGRRAPTPRQIQKAIDRCTNPRLKPSADLTEAQHQGLLEYSKTKAGDVRVKSAWSDAARLSARVEGLESKTLNITQVESAAEGFAARHMAALTEVFEALEADLSPTPALETWLDSTLAEAAAGHRRLGREDLASGCESPAPLAARVEMAVLWRGRV